MIPLLLDMGLPRRAAQDLRATGWDVVHAGELDLATATDTELLRHASDQGRTVVTLDSDFATLLARSRAATPSVVFIRIQRLGREATVRLLSDVLPHIKDDLTKGCIASVNEDSVRIRTLPIR